MAISPEAFYKACNLRANPFRSTPAHTTDPRAGIWVGYEKQQRQLIRYLERTRADQVGNANLVMLFGTWGTGKSHALLWAQNLILEVERTVYNSVCYFVPTLKKSKGVMTFAGAFIDDLVIRSTLVADVQAYRNFLRDCLSRYREENNVPLDVSDDSLVEKLIPVVELYNFAKLILRTEQRAQVQELLTRNAQNDYAATATFTTLTNLFISEIELGAGNRRFKNAVYLFIDELDDLLRTTVKEARLVNDTLRHLYDRSPNCFCLVIALSAEIAELPAIFEDYVLTRIQRRIEMALLDKNDAVDFVEKILDSFREDDNGDRGFFPFDKSAIDTIASQLREITPRKVVNTMQQVLEEVRINDFDPSTSGLVTINELDQFNILDEVLGDGGIL